MDRPRAGWGGNGRERAVRRGPDGAPYLTDGGHLILDCRFDPIPDPEALADRLVAIPGVVEHGLFIGLASAVVTDGDAGTLVVERPSPQPPRTSSR